MSGQILPLKCTPEVKIYEYHSIGLALFTDQINCSESNKLETK